MWGSLAVRGTPVALLTKRRPQRTPVTRFPCERKGEAACPHVPIWGTDRGSRPAEQG